MKQFDLVQAKDSEKDGETKTYWINHGIGFHKEGKDIRIKLESLPIPDKNGEIWLNLFPKKPKDGANGGNDGNPWGDN